MDNLVKYIKTLESESLKIKLLSTYKTLNQVNEIIEYHDITNETEKNAIIIDIYGLLQSLFVGIDSLYSLTIGITNNKFDINVNQNKVLNELKHIRNDIVGHPTNRKYGSYGIAYSVIDNNNLEYNKFIYQTYLFIGNKYKVEETKVDLKTLKNEYLKEKNIIINRLKNFTKTVVPAINLDNEIMVLLNETSHENLKIVRDKFSNNYGTLENHRFIWRLDLIENALLWKETDSEINNLIDYMIKTQIIKLLEISNEMEGKKYRLPHVKLPYLLKKMFKYFDKTPNLLEFIKDLHDKDSVYYKTDLDYLISEVKDNASLKLLKYLKNQIDSEKIYLIGTTVKRYNKIK